MVAPAQGFQATAFAGGGTTGSVDLDSAETAGTLPIAKGGTAATTAAAARTALNVDVAGTAATGDTAHLAAFAHANIPAAIPVGIAQGGTGDTTAAGARDKLSAAFDGGFESASIRTEVGSTTLTLADAGGYVRINNAGATTWTVPPNSSVAFAVGTVVAGRQVGAGQVTVTPGVGVTLNFPAGTKNKGIEAGSSWVAVKVATDVWDIEGALQA